MGRLVATRVTFGEGPYAHPLAGTPRSVQTMTREDVVAFHRTRYAPSRALLVIGGDLEPAEAFELARKVLGRWRDPQDVAADVEAVAPPPPRFVVVDHPPAGRTAIVAAMPAIRRNDPEYYDGIVVTALLSGYSGRLNQEVRVKRGLSYGAGAQLIARRRAGLFTAATLVDHRKAVEATEVVSTTLRSLVDAPPSPSELSTRKTNVLGNFARSVETIEGLITAFGEYAVYGIALDELERFQSTIEAVGADAVAAFAQRYVAVEPSLVLVGHADEFFDELARFGRPVERIPFDALDLGSATLRTTG